MSPLRQPPTLLSPVERQILDLLRAHAGDALTVARIRARLAAGGPPPSRTLVVLALIRLQELNLIRNEIAFGAVELPLANGGG